MQSRLCLPHQKLPGSRKYLTIAVNQWRKVISEKNQVINAFVHCTPPPVESSRGPLAGVAVAVKDNITTYDSPTTCSSTMLKGRDSLHIVSAYEYLDSRIYFAL